MFDGVILGLPLLTWIVVPLLAAPLGILLLSHQKPGVGRIWAVGLAFFWARFYMESSYDIGRPDRVFAVMIMWTIYMLAMKIADWYIHKRYHHHISSRSSSNGRTEV